MYNVGLKQKRYNIEMKNLIKFRMMWRIKVILTRNNNENTQYTFWTKIL